MIARRMRINQQDSFDGVKSLREGTSTCKLNYSENKLLSFYRGERIFQHFNPCAFKTARRWKTWHAETSRAYQVIVCFQKPMPSRFSALESLFTRTHGQKIACICVENFLNSEIVRFKNEKFCWKILVGNTT